jgi:hypothetical protein
VTLELDEDVAARRDVLADRLQVPAALLYVLLAPPDVRALHRRRPEPQRAPGKRRHGKATNRVYATNLEDTSDTRINGASCNGTDASGCARTRTQATVGDFPGAISVDPSIGTAYVSDAEGVSLVRLTP